MKMQAVQFENLQQLMRYLPPDQLLIVEHLRALIQQYLPEAEERLSYNVPFYRRHKVICYFWPGAVPWGKKTHEGVVFGFNYGHLLDDEQGYLERGNRKQVFNKTFLKVEEIDDDILAPLLVQAYENDEMMYREKLLRKKQAKANKKK